MKRHGYTWGMECIAAAVGLAVAACGQTGDRGSEVSGLGGLTSMGSAATEGQDMGSESEGDGTMGDGSKFDLGPNGEPPVDGGNECLAVSEQAELAPVPADIIFVVDNSGSMGFEASEIQARMNEFSSQIVASGVDANVVLISSYPNNGNGICIAPPLGGGGCPLTDSNPPKFTHVNQEVDSHNAWQMLLLTHPFWGNVVRPNSTKHVVVVTDDTSSLGWFAFNALFLALHPDYTGYLHHSVVCHSDCDSAAGVGSNYIMLSDQTGGVAADLCDQNFQAVFDVLTTEVISGSVLSCEFEIPPPPDGMEFDPDQVNIEFDDGMGGVVSIGRVESPAQCADVADGWYYDDPADPSTIVMCPQTCEEVQSYDSASISIQFGCATMPAG